MADPNMTIDATYHRTFLPDGPFEPAACSFGCHRDNNPTGRSGKFEPEFINFQPSSGFQSLRPEMPFRTANMTPPPRRMHYRTQKRRAAFIIVGKEIRPTFIVDKLDQKFDEAATPWEKEYSALVKDGPDRFVPLVDYSYTVVGYVGTAKGTQLIKVKGSTLDSLQYGAMAEYVAAEEVVLVSKTVPDGWEVFNYLQPNPIYTVVTDIFGDVQTGEITDTMPGAISTMGPVERLMEIAMDVFDIVSLATGVLAIGRALVVGLVRTIVRRKIVAMIISRTKAVLGRAVQQVLARRAARKAAIQAVNAGKAAWKEVAGITREHHGMFIQAAEKENLTIVVRHTNPKSIPLIEKGCPGKPKDLEFINTGPESGIVMANSPMEVSRAQKLGYYVVGSDGRTATRIVKVGDKEVYEGMSLDSPFWKVEKGQVIDPAMKKPIVGDYDLMGVVNPKNPGQNIHLVASNGELVTDISSPVVKRAAKAINDQMPFPRVLHGPQDAYKGFRKGATAFEPDGTVRHFVTEGEVKAYYESLGRQTRVGSYARPSPGTPVVDELAARRARR
jgi:hypothetical protein